MTVAAGVVALLCDFCAVTLVSQQVQPGAAQAALLKPCVFGRLPQGERAVGAVVVDLGVAVVCFSLGNQFAQDFVGVFVDGFHTVVVVVW